MRKLHFAFLIFCTVSHTLMGQVTNGARTSLSPTPSTTSKGTKSESAPAATHATDRSGDVHTRSNTPNTYGNTKSRSSVQDRSTRPAVENPGAANGRRPSTYAPPTSATTAKGEGAVNANNKVTPLKPSERGKVNWLTLEQALEKSKVEKRKIFLDLYTDWCGWCKHMDSTTFVQPQVANYLNEHYYPVKFNAEQEQDIVFKDKTYHFKKTGTRGYHELAAFWLNNRFSFPTVVFLDENQNLIQPVPGYQDAAKMETIINYFGSDSHKKVPWETYEKNFSNKR